MVLVFEKFRGDMAIYATCPKCGFRHNPSQYNPKEGTTEIFQYRYCPMCGIYLFDDKEELDIIWDERNIVELYGEGE